MTEITRLPVLAVADLVVLPGMVVPIELDEAAQAAVDAARTASDDTLLLAPRLEDRYAAYGVIATIEQVGRLAGGAPAAVLRAGSRARIGAGSPARARPCGSRPRSSPTGRSPSTTASWPRSTSPWSSPRCRSATPGR